MITSANNKIIVSVEYDQKGSVEVAGKKISLAKQFSANRRESMPVMCKAIEENEYLPVGTFILVHHNRFVENSPHHLGDNIYSLAYNQSIFAKLDEHGSAIGLCDNIIVNPFFGNADPFIPDDLIHPHKFKYIVFRDGFGFKAGQFVFAYEFANYEIIYVWKGAEKRVIKIAKQDIIGKIIDN